MKVPSIPASGTATLFMYYGNPTVGSASNFDSTFAKDYGEGGQAGLWHMDEGSGTTTADISGNGNTGTLMNGPVWQSSDGGQWDGRSDIKFSTGSNLYFDGADDYIRVPHSSSLNIAGNLTIKLWINPQMASLTLTGADPGLGLVSKRTYNAPQPYTLDIANGGVIRFHAHFTGVSNWRGFYTDSGVISLNQWQHVAITRTLIGSAVTVSIYHNGNSLTVYGPSDANLLGSATTNNHDLWLVKDPYFATYTHQGLFKGLVDEVRIYDRVLSAGEIKSHYERRKYASTEPTYSFGSEESFFIGFREDFSNATLDPNWQIWKYHIPAPSPPEATYQQETSYSLTDNPGYLRYYLGTRTVWHQNQPHWGSPYWYYPSMHLYRMFEGTDWILETKVTYSAPYANAPVSVTYIFFGDPQQGQGWKNNSIVIIGAAWDAYHQIFIIKNGIWLGPINLPINRYQDTFYYRLIRSGYQFTFQWSRDGITYTTAFTEAMGSQIDGLPQGLGITGQAFWSDSSTYHEYDYIYITHPWGDWKHYHNYSEIVNTLLYLNLTYPNLVDVYLIGKSWQNRDIYCIRLTNESNTHPKPKVFFVGYHHARELISAELPLYFAVEAAINFGTNETITHMLNYSEIYIVPALNVDAFDVVKQNEWQRKNVHPFDEDDDTLLDEDPPDDADGDGYIEDLFFWNGTHYQFIRWEGIDDDGDGSLNEDWVGGVDINRNYGYQWNATVQSGSPYPWAEDYRGPAPFSEPETQAIRDLALGHDFKYAISFHSGTEVIGYPWGYTTNPTPDDAIFREIAGNLSQLVGAPYGQNSGLYTMSGSWDDWMYGNRSTFALTCEIYTNSSAWQYEPGPDPDTWWEKGVFQFFNPHPNIIETVVQRWLPVFTYITNRAINEAYDIAATNVAPLKTVVGQGYSMQINVTVANQGDFTETLDVTVYINTTAIQTKTVTLTSGASTTLSFTWNTSGFAKGSYTISAYAWPVPGEADTTDNTYTDGNVIVAMIGDITGPTGWPDGKVDIRDIALVAKYFGQNVPPAPPNCDITGPTPGLPDGKIDIRDIASVAIRFGQVDP